MEKNHFSSLEDPYNVEEQLMDSAIQKNLKTILNGCTRETTDLFIELDNNGIVLGRGAYLVICFNLIDEDFGRQAKQVGNRFLLLDQLAHLIISSFYRVGNIYPVIMENNVVCIRYYSRNDPTNTIENMFTKSTAEICDAIVENFLNKYNCKVVYIISQFIFSENKLRNAYMRCKSICQFNIYCHNDHSVQEQCYTDLEDYTSEKVEKLYAYVNI